MHLVYIDDSHDQTTNLYTFAALLVRADRWRAVFQVLKDFRVKLKSRRGIPLHKELHAWKFVSGRGDVANGTIVPKQVRCLIFRYALGLIAKQEGVSIISVAIPNYQNRAFERLLNRINQNMEVKQSHALLVCDEGKELEYTKLVRKMTVFNPIPSRFGAWEDGEVTRNIPIQRILEDPFFKQSERSYFVQMADFCAYALLRQEVYLESKAKYDLHTAFALLKPICVQEANFRDPKGLGIVR